MASSHVRIRSSGRPRCSPGPNTAELIDKILTRPKTCPSQTRRGHRPQTTAACGRRTPCHAWGPRSHTSDPTANGRPQTVGPPPGEANRSFSEACAFVRRRIQQIRTARLQTEKNNGKNGIHSGKHPSEGTERRRTSIFRKRDARKSNIVHDGIREDDMTEEEKQERDRKLKLRHARMTKLIWWFRVLRAICGLAQDMKRLSMAVTENTTVSQVYVYNACGYSGMLDGDQTLFFDKSQFSRRKTMLFPIWAQKLALLGPDVRTEEDVRQIRALMLMMKSFREKYTELMQYKMAKVAMYINCEKGRVILRQDHWGINFYFIYSGSVFVQKETVDPKTKEKKIQTQNIIRAGESFGEIAILGDGKRTASIICREPTEVFQVDKDTFLETCPEVFEAELDAKMAFVEQFEMFLGWDEENLRRMCFLSQAIYIPHGKIIETDWSKTSYAYFVMQGRISLMRKFDITDLRDTAAVHVSGMMDKPLHLPDPEEDKYGGARAERYASVGELHAGDHSDLRVLLNDSEIYVDTLSMVSQGSKVLRVEHRIIRWLGPMATIDEFLRKRYIPFRIPADVQLCQRYVEECNWDVFKRKTLDQISNDRHKKEVAMMPVTCKGRSGWARWPGSGVYRESGTAFHSPVDRREKLAEFLTHIHSKQQPSETTRHRMRRDTVGVPLDIRRTSLFPRSRIQKQILRAFPEDPVCTDRRLTIIPTRPKLTIGKI